MAPKMKVQRPPPGPFTRDKLIWDESSAAHIPTERFMDFVLGESNRIYPRTVFLVDKSRLGNGPDSAQGISEDSLYSEKKSYQCAYGPDDESHIRRPGNEESIIKLGCQCRFEYLKLRSNPEVICIRFEEQGHVTSDGRQSHGTSHPGFLRFHQYAPRRSDKIKSWIFSKLEEDLTSKEILAEHRENVLSRMHTEGIKFRSCRDDFLKLSDIHNVFCAVKQGTWVDREELSRQALERARPIMEEWSKHQESMHRLWPPRTRCEAPQATGNPNIRSERQVGTEKELLDLTSSSEDGSEDVPSSHAAAHQLPEVTSQPTDVETCLREMAKGPQLPHPYYPFTLDNVKEAMEGFQTDHNKRRRQASPTWR